MLRQLRRSLGRLAPLLPLALGLVATVPVAVPARALQPQLAAVREPQLRVLLLQGDSARLRPAAAAAGLRVRDGQGRLLLELPLDRLVQLELSQGWLRLRTVPLALAPTTPNPLAPAQPSPAAESVTLLARELWFEPVVAAGAPASDPDPGLWLQQRRYRGRLQVRLEAGQLQVVNHVPLETYLSSVVGSEMPASWPLDALRAQAVAARTYALKARKPATAFDLQATTASQMYKGVEAETPSTRAAVQDTRGLVLTYDDALIDAVFHSSSRA